MEHKEVLLKGWIWIFEEIINIVFVNQDNNQKVIHIYPNPATDNVEIDVCANYNVPIGDIRIYNLFGVCVLIIETGLKPGSTEKIDVSGLPQGMYYIKILDSFYKFVVIR